MPAPSHHAPLFHPRLVRARAEAVPSRTFEKHRAQLATWVAHLKSGALHDTKETSLHGGFLERIFGDVLGYRTMATAGGTGASRAWDLVAEKSVSAGSADGALGYFGPGLNQVVAPIELKGAAQYLEHKGGRVMTPVQQGFDYANKTPSSRWVVVSNYQETRLYAKALGPAAYETFLLEDVATPPGFARFVALLGRDAVLGAQPAALSPLDNLLVASQTEEAEITKKLYAHYRGIRVRLFEHLRQRHSNRPAAELLVHTQKILDRVLFVAFAEDRGLIRANTLDHAFKHRDAYAARSVWQNFISVFRAVDEGNAGLDIPAYNGGLFRTDPDLDSLELSDEACGWFRDLGAYDFREDVSVDVLGHIFEQSIADLDELRAEAEAMGDGPVSARAAVRDQKSPSKRQVHGIFYTPPFVTSFLVRETLAPAFEDAFAAAFEGKGRSKAQQGAGWEAYRAALRGLRILDPACGSGAFLVAAFDALAGEFARVNRAMDELQTRVGQRSLFDLNKTVLNENIFGIDLTAESVEIARLSLWLKTAERNKKLTSLDRNIRRGNSVVDDPGLDRLAFDWRKGRRAGRSLELTDDKMEAEAIDARWREGFDVVLGNPPYVRQELFTGLKDHFRASYQVFDGTADLFVYFLERSIQVLKPGGRLGFIVSNKWLKGGYAEKLRSHLAKETTIERIVDFGHAPVFADADAFPCILVLRKSTPPVKHVVRVTRYPRAELGKELLAGYVDANGFPLEQEKLDGAAWTLDPPDVDRLMKKLQRSGAPLADLAGVKAYYGIKTGCNEAFVVDQATRDRLVREDPRSAEVLKKFLRGQDVTRWSPVWSGLWMIFARRGIAIENYPAVLAHLEGYRTQLEPKPAEYTGGNWPGRKAGNYRWYELQDAVDYYEVFNAPKLVWKDISFHSEFAFDQSGLYTNDLCFVLPSDDRWLLASLCAPITWAWLSRNTLHGKDEALRLKSAYMQRTPIAPPQAGQRERVTPWVDAMIAAVRENHAQLAGLADVLRLEYGVEKMGNALSDPTTLTSAVLLAELRKRKGGKAALSAAAIGHIRGLYTSEVEPIQARASAIRGLEKKVADEVHAAFGLTAEDLALMWETAPPRMPLGPPGAGTP